MLAVVVLFSIVTGAAGFGVMQWMGFSILVSLIGYPVFGTIGLIGGAAIASVGWQNQRSHAAIPALRPVVVQTGQSR
jgi:hypothetical protein